MTLFAISRTSARHIDGKPEKPCDGAVWMPYVRVDYRTFKTPEEHDSKLHQPWHASGRNHRLWSRGICRDFDDACWFIEVDDVLRFVKQHGTCVIGPKHDNAELMELEIYDAYRE